MNGLGMHHHHRQKIVSQGKYYDNFAGKLRKFIDNWIYLIAVAGPLLSSMQLFKILIEKNAVGVSLFTWIVLLVLSVFWFFYGLVHREWPIIIANFFWVLVQGAVVVGIVMYG
ncbi:MAG: hypothetical protein HYS32_00670 [Candidatus Woesearchaeota archaeon]|nr:MAG: hypothetical protein HYS32_00670 [Candidatus Woesearchaeota archaeon]